jgi:hypothetical protein
VIREDVVWALQELGRRGPDYRLRRDYYEGRHRLAYATDKFRAAFGGLFHAFADNVSTVVVDAVRERLRIEGWGLTEGEGAGVEAAARTAEAEWAMAQLAMVAGEVHQEALALGDAYIIVWPGEDGTPIWHPNIAEETVARYDPLLPGRIAFAAKAWLQDDKRARLTLYYPDRIERYATATAQAGAAIPDTADPWEPYTDDRDGPRVINPWGMVPVFHFPNRAGIGRRGRAEHDHAIPLQDALNKSVLDTLVGGEFLALPQRWATGLELPIDPVTGQEVAPIPGPGMLLHTPAAEARFGQFDSADLRPLLAVSNDWRAEIARVTDTPPHRLMLLGDGPWPSGEALKTAEAPLVAKVENRQEVWGTVWGQAMGLALRMAQNPVDRPLRPVWKPARTESEVEKVTVAEAKVRAGVSRRQVLRELGYTSEEVDLIMEETAAERRAAMDGGMA